MHASFDRVAVDLGRQRAVGSARRGPGLIGEQLLLRPSTRVDALEPSSAVPDVAARIQSVVDGRRLLGVVRWLAQQTLRRSIRLTRTATVAATRWTSRGVGGAGNWKRVLLVLGSSEKTPSGKDDDLDGMVHRADPDCEGQPLVRLSRPQRKPKADIRWPCICAHVSLMGVTACCTSAPTVLRSGRLALSSSTSSTMASTISFGLPS